MRLGILAQDGWHFRQLKTAAGNRHQVFRIDFTELNGTVSSRGFDVNAGQALNSLDCLLVRAMPAGSLQQVVVRMDLLYRLEKNGIRVVNSAKSIEAAVDKYLSLCRIREAGLPTPNSGVFQTVSPAISFFDHNAQDVVHKPIFGSEGQGLVRLKDKEACEHLFTQLVEQQQVICLQEFVDEVQRELRLFVVGRKVFAMSRVNPNDWRKNISLGGIGIVHHPNAEELELAIASAEAVGTEIAGVDVLHLKSGEYRVIEVNSSPGWQAINRVAGINIAKEIIDYLESTNQLFGIRIE